MILNVLILVIGIALVVAGADMLTNGASHVARRFNVSELVIGLTVVAFGTSLPELVVSVISSVQNKPELAIGNVVGSNLFNTLVILGASALVCPIHISRQMIGKDIPWNILSAVILLIAASGSILNGDTNNEISRQSGLLMLCVFAAFIYYTLLVARNGNEQEETPLPTPPLWKSAGLILAGLAGLIFGGNVFVNSASDIAFTLGMSESAVGLTIVAIGTSLPELATSLVAAFKSKAGLAVGNAIGSNIFNILLILGVSSSITPLRLGNITAIDLLMQLACAILVWIFARTSYTLSRGEGAALLLSYLFYMVYLLA